MAKEGTIEQKEFIYRFAQNYEFYIPEPKDNMRASDCLKKPHPVIAATAQLKRITDVSKFYRRLKAFLQHGIKIQSLENTAFERMECEECRQWLSAAVIVYAGNDSPAIKDKKITKLASMLTM